MRPLWPPPITITSYFVLRATSAMFDSGKIDLKDNPECPETSAENDSLFYRESIRFVSTYAWLSDPKSIPFPCLPRRARTAYNPASVIFLSEP